MTHADAIHLLREATRNLNGPSGERKVLYATFAGWMPRLAEAIDVVAQDRTIREIKELAGAWRVDGSFRSTPELLMYLAEEVGELAKEVRLLYRGRPGSGGGSFKDTEAEIGDVLLNVYMIALEIGIDPRQALERKLAKILSDRTKL